MRLSPGWFSPAPAGLEDWIPQAFDRLPPWVARIVSSSTAEVEPDADLATLAGEPLTVVAGRIPDATRLPDDVLRDRVAGMYTRVLRTGAARGLAPLRWWNFIPGIERPAQGGLNRYMVFNAGRHAAYAAAADASPDWTAAIATASAVGTSGDDCFIALVAGREPGRAIENPRQVPAYRYSWRYGPRPPCFARATLAPALGTLFVGGTASVRGEDSVHLDCIHRQLDETLANIRALVEASFDAAGRHRPADPLGAFTSLRGYVVRAADRDTVARRLQETGATCTVDLVTARLCRPELLVELEGVVDVDGRGARAWLRA